jgi:hypothetical protein
MADFASALTNSYRLRIESMLLRAEFEANMSFLEPSIEAMLAAGEGQSNIFIFSRSLLLPFKLYLELSSSQKLQDLFYMILMAGNFLNSVSA